MKRLSRFILLFILFIVFAREPLVEHGSLRRISSLSIVAFATIAPRWRSSRTINLERTSIFPHSWFLTQECSVTSLNKGEAEERWCDATRAQIYSSFLFFFTSPSTLSSRLPSTVPSVHGLSEREQPYRYMCFPHRLAYSPFLAGLDWSDTLSNVPHFTGTRMSGSPEQGPRRGSLKLSQEEETRLGHFMFTPSPLTSSGDTLSSTSFPFEETFLTSCDTFIHLLRLHSTSSSSPPPPLIVHLANHQTASFTLYCLHHKHHILFPLTNVNRRDGFSKRMNRNYNIYRHFRQFILLTTEGDETAAESFFHLLRHNKTNSPKRSLFHRSPSGPPLLPPSFSISTLIRHPLLAHWYGVNGNVQHPKFTPIPVGFLYLPLLFFEEDSPPLFGTPPRAPALWKTWRDSVDAPPVRSPRQQPESPEEQAAARTVALVEDLLSPRMPSLSLLFPHIHHHLRYGKHVQKKHHCVWLEKALEVFAGRTVNPPVKWVKLDELPDRVTTIYVVLMPLERRREDRQYSLTSDVMVIEPEEGNAAAMASHHIALLPFTAALYHKLREYPHGSPERDPRVIASFTQYEWRKDIVQHLQKNSELAVLLEDIDEDEDYLVIESQRRRSSSSSPPLNPLHSTSSTPKGKPLKKERWRRYLHHFSFAATPPGQSYDTFHIWEALVFGAIPIIIASPSPFYNSYLRQMYPHSYHDHHYYVEQADDPQLNDEASVAQVRAQQLRRQKGGRASSPRLPLQPLLTKKDMSSMAGLVGNEVTAAALQNVYDDLPVVIVHSPSEITRENLVRWRSTIWAKAQRGEYKLEKLFLQTWIDKIYSRTNQ